MAPRRLILVVHAPPSDLDTMRCGRARLSNHFLNAYARLFPSRIPVRAQGVRRNALPESLVVTASPGAPCPDHPVLVSGDGAIRPDGRVPRRLHSCARSLWAMYSKFGTIIDAEKIFV
uniref:Uncharacterized protein n=1 Tax=Oryza sativa subsp. japonica TaxID=39947 RepID=Q69S85_ORYSJ|nr:hypothetical protein [Oryza sativa Japonica Group]